jgi:uncharacterized protein YndB with AHSA1/START domain
MSRAIFRPSPLARVESRRDGGRWALVFTRELAHPPEEVWRTLTEPERLREWAPFVADRDLGSVGGATLTTIGGDAAEELTATVLRADRPRLLEYSWGEDLLRWELVPAGGGTRLTLTHVLADRDWLPKIAAGWHLCLDVAERLLDGDPVGPIRGAAASEHGWDALREAYAVELGVRSS